MDVTTEQSVWSGSVSCHSHCWSVETLYAVAPTWQPLVGQLAQERIAAGTVVTASIGPVGSILGVYVYLVFLAGLGIVVKTVFEGSGLFVGRALAFVSGSRITIVASFLTIRGVPVDRIVLRVNSGWQCSTEFSATMSATR